MDTVSLGDDSTTRRGSALLWADRAPARTGPKPALTLDRISDVAVSIADAEGIGAVSMQRVAAEFQYTKMSLYRYVDGKEELVAAMIDRAVGAPPDLSRVRAGWRRQLEEWTRLLAESWQIHVWLPNATIGDRLMGPNEVGWIERAIATLDGTALDPAEKMAVVLMICGHIRNTQSASTAGTQPWNSSQQRALFADRQGDFPALSRVLDARESADRGRSFGLKCLLDGVEAVLVSRSSVQTPSRS